MTIPAEPGELPPPGGSRLVAQPGVKRVLTANRETDARTALTRGLAEYVSQLIFDAFGGRQFQLQQVFQTWAEPEDDAAYPSAVVYSDEPGRYDASKLTPSTSLSDRIALPDGRFLVSTSEYVLNITLEVRTTDPEARQQLTVGLEDMLNPVDFQYGFALDLPHYFGERATYELVDGVYVDDEASAQQRLRRVRFSVTGRVAVSRLAAIPLSLPRVDVRKVSNAPLLGNGGRLL